jgi:hypothetical protein
MIRKNEVDLLEAMDMWYVPEEVLVEMNEVLDLTVDERIDLLARKIDRTVSAPRFEFPFFST